MITWGELAKSQIDPEKIEEAIKRLIAEHNADPEAHLCAGGSLQSHKAAEIIDHLAASIIADKIRDLEIGVSKFKWDSLNFSIDFITIDEWLSACIGSGGYRNYFGSLELSTGSTPNSRGALYLQSFGEGDGADYTKNPRVLFIVKLKAESGSSKTVCVGTAGVNCFGFSTNDDKLYAFHCKDRVCYSTEIATLANDWTFYRLKAVYTSGSKIDFFVDDVLLATHTENLPEYGEDAPLEDRWFFLGVSNRVPSNMRMWVRNILFSQEY